MKKKKKSRHELEWHRRYGDIVASDVSVECQECGYSLLGDGLEVMIVCLDCWKKNHPPDPIGELLDSAEDKE